MQFIQRFRFLRRGRKAPETVDLPQVRAAARRVMNHVGLVGQLSCQHTVDEDGRRGVLLLIETPLQIPADARIEFQHYFHRKLTELGALQGALLWLVLHDLNDQVQVRKAPVGSSSARIASVVAASNVDRVAENAADLLADMRLTVQQRRHARRDEEWRHHAPLTDIGALPAR